MIALKKPLSVATLLTSQVLALPIAEVLSIHRNLDTAPKTQILFFGYQENTHHDPAALRNRLTAPLESAGIEMTFTSSLGDLNDANAANYEGVIMYGNARSFPSSTKWPQVGVLTRYVEGGGALIGIHVASASFRSDTEFEALLGGRFDFHGAGELTPVTIQNNHPLVKNLPVLTAFDETYRLKNLNPDINILQNAVYGGVDFPFTWTRTQGEGRVFYTASGHLPPSNVSNFSLYDEEVTAKPAFHELIHRGTNWATKRHFSNLSNVALGPDGRTVAAGSSLTGDLDLLWQSSPAGPEIFTTEGDEITINTKTFTFPDIATTSLIPCSNGKTIFHRAALDNGGISRRGLWSHDSVNGTVPIVLEGQDFAEISDEVVTQVPENFVANGNGNTLYRAQITNNLSSLSRWAIVNPTSNLILIEGETDSALPIGVVFDDLSAGALSLNSSNDLAATVSFSGTGITTANNQAIYRKGSGSGELVARKGDAISAGSTTLWGVINQLRLNHSGQIAFIATLDGSAVANDDTCLALYSPNSGTTQIILREGQTFGSPEELDDLENADFVLDDQGHIHLFATLRGGSVSVVNDRVLISQDSILMREGNALPVLGTGVTMGTTFGSGPLACDSTGQLVFVADTITSGASSSTLFLVQNGILFPLAKKGDTLHDGPGTPFQIDSIQPLQGSGPDDGSPSALNPNGELLCVLETSDAQSLLVHFKELQDFDQDGYSNTLEAGLGSAINDPVVSPDLFPRLIEAGGTRYFIFNQATDSSLPVTEMQESSTLDSWGPPMTAPEISPDQSFVPLGYQRMRSSLLNSSDLRFLRVRVP